MPSFHYFGFKISVGHFCSWYAFVDILTKLLSLNARSVILKLDELQAEAIELKADIITVTEAWTQMLFYQLMDMNSR